jgi:Protein of unknown function (DUF1647)
MNICFVSGASSNHFKSLKNLIQSVLKFYPGEPFIVFDLGLEQQEVDEIKNIVKVEKFDYSHWPEHVNIKNDQAGGYAWKPIIIHEVAKRTGKAILWLDAGDVVVAPLEPVFSIIEKNGYFSPCSSHNIRKFCMAKTLEYIKIPDDHLNFPSIAAAIVGIDINHSLGSRVLEEWFKLSLIKECILPEGGTYQNNRHDQNILSCLLAKNAGPNYFVPNWWGNELIKIHCDVD